MAAITAFLMREIQASTVTAPEWIHLIPAGTFQARDGRGPFTVTDMAAVIAASLDPGLDMVIDYDHQSDFASVPEVGGTAPAAGWGRKLEAREDGIWAQVQWTPKAAEMLASKEYRYISPVFTADKKTGKVLQILRAALTNTPALPLTSITRTQHGDPSMDELLKTLRATMGLGEDADADTIVASVKELKGSTAIVAAANSALPALAAELAITGEDAKDAAKVITAATSQIKEAGDALTKVAAAAGANEGDGLAVIVAAVERVAGNPDPAQFVPASVVTDLQARVKDLEGDKTGQVVTAAIEAGKITPGQKDWAITYASTNFWNPARSVDA
jgi:phage I-like protein